VPSRWELRLTGLANAAISPSALLKAVSRWLDDSKAVIGDERRAGQVTSGHDDQGRKWTCGPLEESAQPGPGGDGGGSVFSLQVRLLDDGLSERLLAATERVRVVRLDACQYRIMGRPRLVSAASWTELRRWSGARAWQVRFVTPVCFRRQNRTSPWPAPESVARGLAERWHRLDPATAPALPGRGAGAVWVSDIDGHNEVHLLTRRSRSDGRRDLRQEVVSGFVGRIRYVCHQGTDAEAAGFDALMAFAAFAGVGSHTTAGFGVMVPEPTWQPPTIQAE
jgi:CRISPR/Cas system endoribonuclease Cas6 (RAMP superfamily)